MDAWMIIAQLLAACLLAAGVGIVWSRRSQRSLVRPGDQLGAGRASGNPLTDRTNAR